MSKRSISDLESSDFSQNFFVDFFLSSYAGNIVLFPLNFQGEMEGEGRKSGLCYFQSFDFFAKRLNTVEIHISRLVLKKFLPCFSKNHEKSQNLNFF